MYKVSKRLLIHCKKCEYFERDDFDFTVIVRCLKKSYKNLVLFKVNKDFSLGKSKPGFHLEKCDKIVELSINDKIWVSIQNE